MGQEKSSKLSPMGETEGAIKIYMKKNYIQPAAVDLNVTIDNILLETSNCQNSDVSYPEGTGEKRDVWGNIWK